MKTTDFIKESAVAVAAEAMEKESEVQAARQDCFTIAKGSIELYHLLKGMPEVTDLDNECVANLNIAAKYIEDALQYFNVMQEPALEGAFTFESAEARYNELVNEGIDFDQIRKDAEASLKANIDKQSDARIAAQRNPAAAPKEKSFLQKVGDKQIGMVKGAFKGLTQGKDAVEEDAGQSLPAQISALLAQGAKVDSRSLGAMGHIVRAEGNHLTLAKLNSPRSKIRYSWMLSPKRAQGLELVKAGPNHYVLKDTDEAWGEPQQSLDLNMPESVQEDATAGACGSSSIAAVVGGLGEKTGQKSLLKRQGAMSNVLQSPKAIKVKGGY